MRARRSCRAAVSEAISASNRASRWVVAESEGSVWGSEEPALPVALE